MGILFALLSAVFTASKDLISKKVSFSVDGTVSTFASFFFALPFYIVALMIMGLLGHEDFHISSGFLLLVLLRSATDSVAEWCKMNSFAHGDISRVSPYLSLSPLFLLPLAPILTDDTFTFQGAIGVVIIVIGCIVSARRSEEGEAKTQQTRAILFALGFSFFGALNTCFDRLAVHQASPLLSGFLMTLFAAVPFLPGMFRKQGRWRDLRIQWRAFTTRGFLEIAFMVTKLYALKTLETAYVVGLQRSAILVSIVGGKVWFQEKDFARRLAAGVLILLGVILIVWQ